MGPALNRWQLLFLRCRIKLKILQFESTEKYTPVFLDETWIFNRGSFRKSWQNDTAALVQWFSKVGQKRETTMIV